MLVGGLTGRPLRLLFEAMAADAEPVLPDGFLVNLLIEINERRAALADSTMRDTWSFAINCDTLAEIVSELRRLRTEISRLELLAFPQLELRDRPSVSKFERLRGGENVDLSDEALEKLCNDVINADPDDAHLELVMPFIVCETNGGPFEDQAYCAGWEAGVIDCKLMALSAFGQSATDLLCVEANWPQVSLILMKHGWNVDESSMSIADGWVSVKVVGF